MKNNFFLLGLMILALQTAGQGSQTRWAIGTAPYGIISFQADSFILDTFYSTGAISLTSACYNSYKGDFLCTNGKWIRGYSGDTILNGGHVYSSQFVDTNSCSVCGMNFLQSCLFLPSPVDSSILYLFNAYPIHGFINPDIYIAPEMIYRSTIKLNGANGKPEVIEKDISIFFDTLMMGTMTATKHANGRDWWLLVHEFRSDRFYKFLITGNGITGPVEQRIGSKLTGKNYFLGNACFSPDGSRYAVLGKDNNIDVYDFNRCTGELSNFRHDTIFQPNPSNNNIAASCAFSKGGRFLYINTLQKLYQYDFLAGDFASSRILIDTCDHFNNWGLEGGFGYLALAPNGKIYLSTWNGIRTLHEINYPDSVGTSCHFIQHFDSLPFSNARLPNVVNYDLGPTDLFAADAGKEKSILEGQSTLIGTASVSGITYVWFPSSGLNNPNIAQPSASPEQTTVYYLTISDENGMNGCEERMDSVTVTVNKVPFIPSYMESGNPVWHIQNLPPNSTLILYDMLGRIAYSNGNYNNDLNFNFLAAGVYYYKLALPQTGALHEGKIVWVR